MPFLLCLVLGLACLGPGGAPSPSRPNAAPRAARNTVAVLPFTQAAGGEDWRGLGPGLAGVVTSELAAVDGLVLVERARLDALLGEIALGKGGYVDPASAARLGEGLGAEMVVVGTYSVVNGRFLMDARLVRVETGEIVEAGSGSATVDQWTDASALVVAGLVGQLGLTPAPAAAPPELVAIESYGRGLDSRRSGDEAAARAAFEVARGWGPADAELAGLDAVMSRTRADLDAVQDRWRRAALDTLGTDPVDRAIRWGILEAEGQWCTLAAEEEAWFAEHRWNPPAVGSQRLDRRLAALELAEDDAVADASRRGDLPWQLYGSKPVFPTSGWVVHVERCHHSLARTAEAWKTAAAGVSKQTDGGVPLRFALETGHAWLLARHTGVIPDAYPAAVEALGTRAAVALGEEVRDAALDFRFRGGRTDAELVDLADAVGSGDGTRVVTDRDPCLSWVYSDSQRWRGSVAELRMHGPTYAQVAELGRMAWVYQARGCVVGGPSRFADARAVLAAAKHALTSGACPDDVSLDVAVRVHAPFLGRGGADHERALVEALHHYERCR
ncbi:MAG: FlgO family outer membrane protein [Myxococcota bacterium]